MFTPNNSLHKIALVGVGGCGHKAIEFSQEALKNSVDYYVFDTDIQGLEKQDIVTRVAIGSKTTNGRSANREPDIGQMAALESMSDIIARLQHYDLIYFLGGLGGGTATGVLPEIAKQLHEYDCITLFAVTTPFEFEGRKRMRFSDQAIQDLVKYGDATLTISNQKMLETLTENTVDEILKEAILGVCSLIMNTGNTNLSYADFYSILDKSA